MISADMFCIGKLGIVFGAVGRFVRRGTTIVFARIVGRGTGILEGRYRMTTTLPGRILQVLDVTSVECLACGTGRLETLDNKTIYCPECAVFFQVCFDPGEADLPVKEAL